MISELANEKIFWTRKMNLNLVRFIESKPHIWNPKHPKYTSVKYRDKTYSEFAEMYGNEFSGQAVKHRWTNIRSTFANYLRKVNASRSKPDSEEYKVNWHLWEPCQFLIKVHRKLKAASTATAESSVENGSSKDETLQEKETYTNSDNESIPDQEQDSNISTNISCTDLATSLLKVFKGVQDDALGLNHSKYGHVGRTVARKLSQMSSLQAARASSKIMEILLLYNEKNPLNPNNLKSKHNYES